MFLKHTNGARQDKANPTAPLVFAKHIGASICRDDAIGCGREKVEMGRKGRCLHAGKLRIRERVPSTGKFTVVRCDEYDDVRAEHQTSRRGHCHEVELPRDSQSYAAVATEFADGRCA